MHKIQRLLLVLLIISGSLSIIYWLFYLYIITRIEVTKETVFPIIVTAGIIIGLGLTLVCRFVWHNRFLRVLSDVANAGIFIGGGLYGLIWAYDAIDLLLILIFLLIPAFLYFGSQYFPFRKNDTEPDTFIEKQGTGFVESA